MSEIYDKKGSSWSKWDLHVHTPDSLIHHYGSDDAWDKFIKELAQLPPEFKVLGINDYIFLDGYKKVCKAKDEGQLPNIKLLLPVIEFRVDKFGGSQSNLSKVNYHVIFSDKISPQIIEEQFLTGLCTEYVLTPKYSSIRELGSWIASPTRQSLEDLGNKIIESVSEAERRNFDAPIIEGFNNLCLNLAEIKKLLLKSCFRGNFLTAVGKTEWADIKWNDQSIANKKTIINGADLVFISSKTVDLAKRAQVSLESSFVNSRLLDCSDAHHYSASTDKDRLGKCFTWIKAEPTFEGLRQAVFEYPTRVEINSDKPLAPPMQIKSVQMSFPADASLLIGKESDSFCFQGENEFVFSPFFTCVIGGRGTGKSTLLNILHEKVSPGSVDFFKKVSFFPAGTNIESCVNIQGISDSNAIEFLQQNEIEQFASEHSRLTSAIFSRLRKLDSKDEMSLKLKAVGDASEITQRQIEVVKEKYAYGLGIVENAKELKTQNEIVKSVENEIYKTINSQLSFLNKELQELKSGKIRFKEIVQKFQDIVSEYSRPDNEQSGDLKYYEKQIDVILKSIGENIQKSIDDSSIQDAQAIEDEKVEKIVALKEQLGVFLKTRGLSEENLADIGSAAEKIAQIEEKIASDKLQNQRLQIEIDNFSSLRFKAEEYKESVQALLDPINKKLKNLSSEVKPIEMQYQFDMDSFQDAMTLSVINSINEFNDRTARQDVITNRLKDIGFESLSTKLDFLDKLPSGSAANDIMLSEWCSNDKNFEILKLQAELHLLDVNKHGKIKVTYDGKPLENSSFGQRCTAVIVVLMFLGNTPIVIDEPEAHLDSILIAKYLVELIKECKINRQVIFATHNANFVINGDAELIHCLSMDERNVTNVCSTTIENLEHRDKLLALEGGESAFHLREKRYGI